MKGLWAEDRPVGENSVCKSPVVRGSGGVSLCGWGGEGEEEEGSWNGREGSGLTLWDLEFWVSGCCFSLPKLGSNHFRAMNPFLPCQSGLLLRMLFLKTENTQDYKGNHTLAHIHEDFVPFMYIFT